VRITTKAEYRWDDTGARYFLARWSGYELPDGTQVSLCKGPSSSEQSIADNQKKFTSTLQSDYGTTFGNQQQMLNNLSNSLTNTVKGGPGQYGFSAQEDTGLRTQADSGTSAAYRNAKQAAGEAAAAAGGGNMVLPTGATTAANEQLAQAAAQQQSNQQLGITTAGYQQGNQNYNNALSAEEQVASMENPTSYASSADSSGKTAFGEAQAITNEKNAANPWGAVGGIVGSVAGSFLGPIGAAAGGKLGSMIGGAAGGATSTLGKAISDGNQYTASLDPEASNPMMGVAA
jgi:hypothetical protein